MIAVVADDITGAAEIAGIAHRFGLRVNLTTEVTALTGGCDVLVCATNTRSLTRDEAAAENARLGTLLRASGCRRVFKKTDSVLRGHIVAELRGLMGSMNFRRALLLPANPSRGRIIREGMYYVDEVPLDRTAFGHDPEFPAFTADVVALLHGEVGLLSPGEELEGDGVFIANATSVIEMVAYLPLLVEGASTAEGVLAAGGADFFTLFLQSLYPALPEVPIRCPGISNADALFICGSTARHALHESDYICQRNIPVSNMPAEVFAGASSDAWAMQLKELYLQHHSLLIHIDHPPRIGTDFAARLRNVMARVVASLLAVHLPQELVIEGGATAFAVLHTLAWKEFRVENEIAPGLIRISPKEQPGVFVTMKPGSYPWTADFFSYAGNEA